ncbi:nuclear receptor coactivator 7 [Lampris incognitus]|uniref:nuclear receptor coactivator 7 n=1 Tax=Lampris incognitus TaxID=2546036 RepID=UPI0024B5CA5E|nr:nuclear receptor coactivator 7 [Lampris incognitus]
MEKRERKPGYFARLKRRKQLKQSQSEKSVNEQNPANSLLKSSIISCSDIPNATDPRDKTPKADLQRITEKPTAGLDNDCKSNHQVRREKRRPPGTVEFTVGPSDTLNSIALGFNITPNKLVQLNKLFARSVYPGQKLFVPDVSHSESGSKSHSSCDYASKNGPSEKESLDVLSNSRSAKPIQRELSPASEDDSPATVKFIKMSCKYFTDGMGVVGGVMIVTPNNIMFDPHKSDPLVIEHGCEEYGLICPMEEVVSIALYDDVSRMKLKDALPSDLPQDLCPVYRPGEWEQLPSEHDLNPFSRYEALDPKRPIVLDDIDSALSDTGSAGEQTEKSPSDEGFTELEPSVSGSTEEPEGMSSKLHSANSGDQQELLGPSHLSQGDSQDKYPSNPVQLLHQTKRKLDEEEDEGVAQISSTEDGESLQSSLETEKPGDAHDKPTSLEVNETKDVKSKGTDELVNDIRKLTGDTPADQNRKFSLKEPPEVDGKSSLQVSCLAAEQQSGPTKDDELSEEERRKKNYETEVKSWLLQRMQAPIEDMLLSSEEKSKNPPMFLCFKVGKPMRKSFAAGRTSSPVHSYGGRGKQPEYWFAVPQERVDHLYAFFVQWSPEVYGKDAREQGFVVVEKDELDMIDNFFSDPASCSWEIITIDEAKRRQSFGSYEGELCVETLPILSDASDLLQDTQIEKLACRLPARVQGYPWKLAYSTVKHGTSLKTLYRKLAEVDSPVLLVIKDMDNQVFGAFSTHPFRVSEHCYGTGETFLYSFCPEIKVYRWTGENSYFVKGNTDSLQMGGGGGQLGLWLDAELYRGTTNCCATFNNQPLSTQQDFNIHSVEVWTFE